MTGGEGSSNPIADPNPRLQLLIEAARRGAKVRLLLDGLFDDPAALRSNQATVEYLEVVATAEGLDIVGAGYTLRVAASSSRYNV